MAFQNNSSPDYARGVRRVALGVAATILLGVFLLWRVDNIRVEQFRISLLDRIAPSFEWTLKPAADLANMLADVKAYTRVYQQNEELRRELQRMRGWREAALQLEQKNAQLLALNNVRLNPRLTYVTGEIIADAGSPFSRSALVNVGRLDGVLDGAAVLDGMGLVGRIAGVGDRSSRILMLNDVSSWVPATIRPSGQHALVSGDNGAEPALDFLDRSDEVTIGDRVVTSGDGGIFPPDLLIGRVVEVDGRRRVRPSAAFEELGYVRIVRRRPAAVVAGTGAAVGPLRAAPDEPGAIVGEANP